MAKKNVVVNILMAEDDDAEFALAREVFARSDMAHRLMRFENGKELIDYLLARGRHEGRVIDKSMPLVIILDMNMPVMEGRATLTKLKTDPCLRKLPVIMLTSSDAQEDIIDAYDSGANSYIRKPLTFAEFAVVVDAMKSFWFDIAELPRPLDLPGRDALQPPYHALEKRGD